MSVWRRIARLVGQSRIRLPSAPVTARELARGDWVQLGSDRWRVTMRRVEVHRVVFRLRRQHAAADAVLTAPRGRYGKWTLETGATSISLPPDVLLVFPSGAVR